jgi:hypothetical protein
MGPGSWVSVFVSPLPAGIFSYILTVDIAGRIIIIIIFACFKDEAYFQCGRIQQNPFCTLALMIALLMINSFFL